MAHLLMEAAPFLENILPCQIFQDLWKKLQFTSFVKSLPLFEGLYKFISPCEHKEPLKRFPYQSNVQHIECSSLSFNKILLQTSSHKSKQSLFQLPPSIMICISKTITKLGQISLNNIKLMIKLNRFAFSTIALISGAPKHDQYLASIANTLQSVSKQPNTLVGVVGSGYESALSKVYASSNLLDNHQFEVTRAYNTYHEVFQDSPLLPYRTLTHLKNYNLVKTLEKNNFFNDVFDNKFSAVVTVGNFSLSLRISQKLNAYCKTHGKVRPYTALFHRQVTERTVENQQFLDYQYYNIEKPWANGSGYTFPSLCVGYNGLYKAFQHLQQFKAEPSNDSFLSENFSYDVSDLVRKSRGAFRSERNIPEDSYVIYIDAGNTPEQVKFSFKSFKDGLNTFFNDNSISSVNKSHFQILVNVSSEKVAETIKGKLGFLPSEVKVTLIEQKDKYAAIAASDFGMLHNGQATVEAAAMQLPSLVVDNRSNFHAYHNNLYNGHASPLNIATNFEGYEDLCGSLTAKGFKISSIMVKNFQSPKYRFYYAKLYRQQIQKILSKTNTNTALSVSQTGLQTGCKHLLQKAETYCSVCDNSFRRESQRKQALCL